MNCRGMEELIHDAVEDRLTPERRQVLDRHLAACAGCREELEVTRKISGELRSLPQEELPPFFRARLLAEIESHERAVEKAHRSWSLGSLRLAWGTAAVLALFLVGTIWWFQGGGQGLFFRPEAPTPSFSQAQVPGGLHLEEARMAALRAGIQPVSPLDDSIVDAHDVAICAALSQKLPPAKIRLMVDGRDVTALTEITSDYLIFAPEESLGDGPHLVTVELSTPQERVERSWIFYALDGDGRTRLPERREGIPEPGSESPWEPL